MLTTHIKMATRIKNCLIYLNPTYLSIQDQSLFMGQRIQPLMVVGFTGAFDMLYRSATTSRCYAVLLQHQGYGSFVLCKG